jgi:hypothetical protein
LLLDSTRFISLVNFPAILLRGHGALQNLLQTTTRWHDLCVILPLSEVGSIAQAIQGVSKSNYRSPSPHAAARHAKEVAYIPAVGHSIARRHSFFTGR